jgi:hypothetical protein
MRLNIIILHSVKIAVDFDRALDRGLLRLGEGALSPAQCVPRSARAFDSPARGHVTAVSGAQEPAHAPSNARGGRLGRYELEHLRDRCEIH